MKIQYCSDLHLEFSENRDFLRNNPLIPIGDILIVAGDSIYLNNQRHFQYNFWDWASDNFAQTLVVPGNHEFYGGGDIALFDKESTLSIRPNVTLHYNKVVEIKGVDFILTPLWSMIHPQQAELTGRCVADFHQIWYDGKPFTFECFNEEHKRCVDFINEALATPSSNRRVVVSHHVPSMSCTAAEFAGSPINGAFTAELDDLICTHSVDYWIYGHSHRNVGERTVGKTRLVCNQLGYVSHGEHHSFRDNCCIEI